MIVFSALKETLSNAGPLSGADSAASTTNVADSHSEPSAYDSRPKTPPHQDRRASSPLTLSKLSPSKQTPDVVLATRPPASMVASAERAALPEIATAIAPVNPASSAQPKDDQASGQPPVGRALKDPSGATVPSIASVPTAGPSKAKAKPAVKVLAGKPQAKKQATRRRSSVQRNYCVPSATAKQKSVPRPGALAAKRRAGLQDQEHAGTSARRRDHDGLASSGEDKKQVC